MNQVKNFIVKYRKLWFAMFLFVMCLQLAACSTAWTGEASNIIAQLIPAIEIALSILAAAGVGLAPTVITAVQGWGAESQKDLAEVKTLIDQYNTAQAGAQPGILEEIQTMLSTISKNFAALLPDIHVSDENTQKQIELVFSAISDEITALIGLVPALQGKITDHDQVKALMANLKSAKAFKKDFNEKAGVFGSQYQL